MSIDLAQFHQVFFEESIEGLDIMESSLMELAPENIDAETINAIFRCAHSIKGGSATFGFNSIAEFTHVLETLLDEVRSGKRGLSTQDIDLYLQSVDCMREMLSLLQGGESGETQESAELLKQFVAILEGASVPSDAIEVQGASASGDTKEIHAASTSIWKIHFAPHASFILTGNDPLKNIQALSELGELRIIVDDEKLPTIENLNTEHMYLAWNMELVSQCERDEICEVFEWVEDECDLTIEHQSSSSSIDAQVSDVGASSEQGSGWSIEFLPGLDILRSGNEPGKLFVVLAEFGEISISADCSRVPDLNDMDIAQCYLSWRIELKNTSATYEEIVSVFEWVEDESLISVSALESSQDNSQIEQTPPTSKEAVQPQASQTVAQETSPPSAVSTKNKAATKKTATKSAGADTSSIRVGIDKVDSLINMVGELVITQSMLGQLSNQLELERVPNLVEGLSQLEQNTRELQESVMKIRMLPISFVFSRFPRMVRDLGKTLGKSVELIMHGENTELDKTVMEKIGDPLVHLVRNAVDHGLEQADVREANGKSATGTVTLNAFHKSGNVVIEIIDDGKGLDRDVITSKAIDNGLISEAEAKAYSDGQVFDLIFQPGFSTAKTVSDVSGRGVGMDVVKRNIQALNGVVEISSKKSEGSKITIKLPLTLAILDGQLVKVGDHTYIFPLTSIIESLQCDAHLINRVAGGCSVFKLRDEYVPIIELYKTFSVEPDSRSIEDSLLVVVESEGEKLGIVVDDLLAQQQVVIKSLEQNYRKVEGISGATILGDGTVALILDIAGIIKLSEEQVGFKAQSLGGILSEFDGGQNTHASLLGAAN